MASLMNRISKFAKSPEGRRAVDKAKNYASSPEGKRKIEQVRKRFAKRQTGG